MVLRQQINSILVSRGKVSAYGQVILAAISWMVAYYSYEAPWVYWGFGTLMALNLTRVLCIRIYPRFEKELAKEWYIKYFIVSSMTGFLWGAITSTLLYQFGFESQTAILLLIVSAGIAASATAALSPARVLARTFVCLLLLPIGGALFYTGGPLNLGLGAVVYFNLFFLFFQIKVNSDLALELNSRRTQMEVFEEVALEAIIIHDSGTVLAVNTSFERMFGFKASEVIGHSLEKVTPPEDRETNRKYGFQDSEVPREVRGLKKDGTIFQAAIIGRWFFYEGKRVRIACIQDITAKFKAEEAIREREKIALESAHTKSQFLANMSHEIRTPLNAIIGITNLLDETPLNDLQRKYFRTMKDSGEALLNLINDILDFSKIDAQKIELEEVEFSLAAAVEGQVSLLANRARQQNISLEVFVDPQMPLKVRGDYGRLGQVLLNLVSNSLKFTEDGRVRVESRVVSHADGKLRARFEVRDTGIGISAANAAKLFTPFTQADSSTARKHGGTGLGLSICQKLIQLMGGEIGFNSVEGRGTTFWFELPFVVSDPQTLSATRELATMSSARIVVLKDEMSIVDVLNSYLTSWGMNVVYHELATIDQADADIIIAAAGAPFELLTRKLQELEMQTNAKKKPLLVAIENDMREKGEAAKTHASISTPVRYSDLFNVLNELLNGKSSSKKASPGSDNKVLFPNSRVLVAEDNSTNQMIIMALLKQLGIQTHSVRNGEEAVDAFGQDQYDLILMDCQMPELDGYEATTRIRKLEKTLNSHIPIVALTANVLKEDRDRCFECGMDDFLSKPIRKEKLIDALGKYLKKAA